MDDGCVPLTVRKVSAIACIHENKIIYMGAYGVYFVQTLLMLLDNGDSEF